jgi:hypothetical protein
VELPLHDPPEATEVDDPPKVLYESAYGLLPRFLWYFAIPFLLVVSGILFVRAVWFGQGLLVRTVRLSADVVAWAVCPGMWLLCTAVVGLEIYRRYHPLRVLVTTAGLHLPKGRFTADTLFIPWDELDASLYAGRVALMDFYEVTCTDQRDGSCAKIASPQFRDFDDFATFALIIGKYIGEDWSIKGFLPGTYRGRKYRS